MDDVTTALFHFKSTTNSGVTEVRENFGERYTEPSEEMTDVRTAFLAGFTVTPASGVNIRLLMAPNFTEGREGSQFDQLQWWVGLTLTP